MTRLEIGGVKTVAAEIDDAAFIIVHPISDVSGGTVKRRVLH